MYSYPLGITELCSHTRPEGTWLGRLPLKSRPGTSGLGNKDQTLQLRLRGKGKQKAGEGGDLKIQRLNRFSNQSEPQFTQIVKQKNKP